MESKGDPILDLQAICQESPKDRKSLEEAFEALGWGIPFEEVLTPALGVYLTQDESGLYHSRNGSVQEILAKFLGGK